MKKSVVVTVLFWIFLGVGFLAGALYFKSQTPKTSSPYINVTSLAEVQLHASATPVLLDFYADWCAVCKKMERTVFSEPDVKSLLSGGDIVKLRVDLTTPSEGKSDITREHKVLGMPTLIVLIEGEEVGRFTGEVSSEEFVRAVRSVLH